MNGRFSSLSKIFNKHWKTPGGELGNKAVGSFSVTQKTLFYFLFAIFAISALILLQKVNNSFLVEVPAKGGEMTEGIVGTPRFINPLLALTDADKDLSILVYSGLTRAMPDGTLVPDLAENYSISEDGLTYTFTIREEAKFHDGEAVTADDVIFTIEKAVDPALKSPKRGNWDGIVVEKVNDQEVRFVLSQPYGPFLENTTLGILPSHLWKDATTEQFSFSEFNTEPIGSGPYKVSKVRRNSAGIPTSYTLKSFSKFTLGEPFIRTIVLKFFPNEEALKKAYEKGEVEGAYGLSASTVHELENKNAPVEEAVLPRVFGVFFNQNQAHVFTNKEVREALDVALPKERIISEVLYGYGTPIESPIPPVEKTEVEESSLEERVAKASQILEDAGWEKNEESGVWEKETKTDSFTLSFALATGDAPELRAAAQIIEEGWEALGVDVNLQIFETGDLNQNIIRPRKYDALLFGEVVGREKDLYPFWHSSQRNDPGLNIALYVNSDADDLLEEARATSNQEVRDEKNREFAEIIIEEKPVVFAYAPSFLYVVPKNLKGLALGQLTTPSERFLNIFEWYENTDKVWKIFIKK